MNQREFYKMYVEPFLTDDRPANRALYNDNKDAVHRDGLITDWQVQNWCYPDTDKFLAPSERKIVKKGR